MGRVQKVVCVSIGRSFFLVSSLYQTSETEHASFENIVASAPDDAGRDSGHRRIEIMRYRQVILRALTCLHACIARTRACKAVRIMRNLRVWSVRIMRMPGLPCVRAKQCVCFVAQDPLRRCVFGSSERAVRRFRNSRSRH